MSTEGKTYPLEYHELANMFPMLSQNEIEELGVDIGFNGQREPVTLFEGKILDGRNRYEACRYVNIEPQFTEYTGTDPVRFVISKNLARRHLKTKERAAIAAKLANMVRTDTLKQNTDGSNEPTDKISNEKAAELMGVSVSSVKRAKVEAEIKEGNRKPKPVETEFDKVPAEPDLDTTPLAGVVSVTTVEPDKATSWSASDDETTAVEPSTEGEVEASACEQPELQSYLNERDPVNVSRIMQMLAIVLASSIDTVVGYNSFKEFENYWNDILANLSHKRSHQDEKPVTEAKVSAVPVLNGATFNTERYAKLKAEVKKKWKSEFNKFGEEQFLMPLAA